MWPYIDEQSKSEKYPEMHSEGDQFKIRKLVGTRSSTWNKIPLPNLCLYPSQGLWNYQIMKTFYVST